MYDLVYYWLFPTVAIKERTEKTAKAGAMCT